MEDCVREACEAACIRRSQRMCKQNFALLEDLIARYDVFNNQLETHLKNIKKKISEIRQVCVLHLQWSVTH